MKQQRIYPAVHISSKAERAVKGGHPWVYGEEITSEDADIRDGCIVDVFAGNAWQGSGFYNSNSKIRVRLISRNSNDSFVHSGSAA